MVWSEHDIIMTAEGATGLKSVRLMQVGRKQMACPSLSGSLQTNYVEVIYTYRHLRHTQGTSPNVPTDFSVVEREHDWSPSNAGYLRRLYVSIDSTTRTQDCAGQSNRL